MGHRRNDEQGSRGRLYPRVLGTAWNELDEAVRRAHADGALLRATGAFRVRRRSGGLAWLLLRLARVPPPGEAIEVRLAVERDGPVEQWRRTFGTTPLVTMQREGSVGVLIERFGSLEFHFRLAVIAGTLVYRQVATTLRLGPLSLPLPRSVAPQIIAQEEPAGSPDRTHLVVEVTGPNNGLLFSYEGSVLWERPAR